MSDVKRSPKRGRGKGHAMREEQGILRLGPSGALVVAHALREKLGIFGGVYLKAEVKNGKLILTPVKLAWTPMHEKGAAK